MSVLERLYAPPEIGAPGKRVARTRRRDLLLTGGFVLIALLIVAGMLALLAPGLFGGAYRLRSYFSDARGLERGILVVQDGFTIGAVESVQPVFPGQDADAVECPPAAAGRNPRLPCFCATLRLRRDWPVPDDSRAQIASAGLLSGDAIRIVPGASRSLLTEGAVLPGDGRELDLMARLNGLSDTLQGLVDNTIAPALADIQRQIATVGELLGTGGDGADGVANANRERLAGAFASLQRITADLEQLIDPEQLGRIVRDVEQMTGNLASLSGNLGARGEDVRIAIQGYSDLATDLRRVIRNTEPGVQTSVDSAQALLQELAAGLAPIMANIETASRELSALTRELRQSPITVIRGREQREQAPWFKQK